MSYKYVKVWCIFFSPSPRIFSGCKKTAVTNNSKQQIKKSKQKKSYGNSLLAMVGEPRRETCKNNQSKISMQVEKGVKLHNVVMSTIKPLQKMFFFIVLIAMSGGTLPKTTREHNTVPNC